MDFLNNSEVQFIISISISVIFGCISIWLALKGAIQLPLTYETLAIEPVDGSEDDLKEILEKARDLPRNKPTICPYYVTFRIWNSGKDSIRLPNKSNPLTIAFNRGTRILYCQKLETKPSDIKVNYKVDAEKLLVVVPLLDPKESITLKIMVSDYVDYLPRVFARVPGRKRIVRANNIRSSKEMKILALLNLCAAISFYQSFHFGSSSLEHYRMASLYFIPCLICLLGSIFFFLMSWAERKMPPLNHMLPSIYLYVFFIAFVYALPVLIPIGILAVIIYFCFGVEGLRLLYLIASFIIAPLGLWNIFYTTIIAWLQKRQKPCNTLLIGTLTGILPLAFLGLCAYTFVTILLPR